MYPRLTLDIRWRRLLWAAFGGPMPCPLPGPLSGDLVTALSVRTLFDAVLGESGLPPGPPVLMTGVNIQNMADLVRLHGLEPHFVDLIADTLLPTSEALLAAQARTGARLCLIAHLFGARSPIAAIDILRARGVCVVEDLAQGYSPEALAAVPAGDVTLFSFGPIKRRTALGGALARCRDPGLAARLRTRLATYPPLDDGWYRARAGKYLALKALNHPLPYSLVFALLSGLTPDPDAAIGRLARGFSGDDLLRSLRRRPPERLLQLMARQMSDDDDLMQRQAISEAFLAALPPALRSGQTAQTHIHWLVPVTVANPDDFVRTLRRHGFDATRGATSLRAFTGTGTVAHDLIHRIVYLPHPADMDARGRTRLLGAVEAAAA